MIVMKAYTVELEAELNQLKEENAQLKHALVFINLWNTNSFFVKGIVTIGLCFGFVSTGRVGEEEEATGSSFCISWNQICTCVWEALQSLFVLWLQYFESLKTRAQPKVPKVSGRLRTLMRNPSCPLWTNKQAVEDEDGVGRLVCFVLLRNEIIKLSFTLMLLCVESCSFVNKKVILCFNIIKPLENMTSVMSLDLLQSFPSNCFCLYFYLVSTRMWQLLLVQKINDYSFFSTQIPTHAILTSTWKKQTRSDTTEQVQQWLLQ